MYKRQRTPFADLPFYASFPMFTPIPKAKDTKDNYQNSPMATGPYTWDTYTCPLYTSRCV